MVGVNPSLKRQGNSRGTAWERHSMCESALTVRWVGTRDCLDIAEMKLPVLHYPPRGEGVNSLYLLDTRYPERCKGRSRDQTTAGNSGPKKARRRSAGPDPQHLSI
jgi:hypothetical protein